MLFKVWKSFLEKFVNFTLKWNKVSRPSKTLKAFSSNLVYQKVFPNYLPSPLKKCSALLTFFVNTVSKVCSYTHAIGMVYCV